MKPTTIRSTMNARRSTAGMPTKLTVTALCMAFLMAAGSVCAKKSASEELSDNAIALAVEHELLLDEAVSSHLVDVEAIDGIVTLDGMVSNILARDRAVELAGTVKGVRSIVNELQVSPVARSDSKIRQDVIKALALDPATESYEIDVAVKGGEVALSGTVQSWAEHKLAEKVTKGVKGVKAVENDLTINYKEPRSDEEILAEIKRRMELDPRVAEGLVDVAVDDGEVMLSGTVGSLAEKNEARFHAYVLGVDKVNTEKLKVEPWLKSEMRRKSSVVIKSDKALEKAVKDALLFDPRTLSFKLDVEANAGVVTLRGVVDNYKSKRAAERDAANTIGVSQVVNLIKVRNEEPLSNKELTADIEKVLRWDPYLERYEITPVVRNQEVYLYGTVDNFYERNHAADVVASVDGVAEVTNMIDVEFNWTWQSDRQIKRDINDELFWSWRISEEDIKVSVDDGEAKLTGTLDSWQEMYAAVNNAFEGGAKLVKANVTVRGSGDVTAEYAVPVYYETYYWYD